MKTKYGISTHNTKYVTKYMHDQVQVYIIIKMFMILGLRCPHINTSLEQAIDN